MPSVRRIPITWGNVLSVSCLTLTFGICGFAQDQPPKVAGKPAEQVFPSATPAPSQPSQPSPSVDESSSSPRLGVGDLLEISVYNVPELSTKSRLGKNVSRMEDS
jgi:hypothetical protein